MLFRVILVLCSLLLCEGALRIVGFEPYTKRVRLLTDTVEDAVLGWRNQPSTITLQSRDTAGHTFTQTILPSGARRTCTDECIYESSTTLPPLYLVGDSFMFGLGLDDRATFGWKLQEALLQSSHAMFVVNYAVPGYGTYQSLLMFRTLVANGTYRGGPVIYSLNDFHEPRNVGDPEWRYILAQNSSSRNVVLPTALVSGDGSLREVPPRPYYSEWPFREHSALISLAEEIFSRLRAHVSNDVYRPTLFALLEQFDKEVATQGGHLYVMLTSAPRTARSLYIDFAHTHGISVVDCVHPHADEPQFMLRGDPHPNEAVQDYWRDCMMSALSATQAAQSP